jgi:hypothetical protein
MLDPDDGPGIAVLYLGSKITLTLDSDPKNGLA